MLELRSLSKQYGQATALNHVSASFEEGNIYGILGSNGAGKTTLLNLIANRIFPTTGQVLLDGEPITENEAAQGQIFCITEKDQYPRDFNARELFLWESRFYDTFDPDYAAELARRFDLDLGKKIKNLSTGYYTIFKAIVTVASNCRIMILDEPVLGIDSLYRDMFYEMIQEHHRTHGNLILIATHLIDEVEPLLDYAVILFRGRILRDAPVRELTAPGQRLNEAYVELLKEARHG